VATVATGFQFDRLRYEEPEYVRISLHDAFEVRRYGPRIVAETVVDGDADAATSEGFRRLADYIFGGNEGGSSISMTTPVEQSSEGSRISMTTPVERSGSDGRWTVTFTMPSEYTLDTLPKANDPRVVLREVRRQPVAVLRFSGRADERAKQRRAEELLISVRASGYEPIGEPTLAQYDPPWVLGPFRRNEVMIPVRSSG
jgi:hypothetical protein